MFFSRSAQKPKACAPSSQKQRNTAPQPPEQEGSPPPLESEPDIGEEFTLSGTDHQNWIQPHHDWYHRTPRIL